MVAIKGGEVLIILWKINTDEIWPRLLASNQKVILTFGFKWDLF